MENILICFEIYQAQPILIGRTRHSHRPNVMLSFDTASSERGGIFNGNEIRVRPDAPHRTRVHEIGHSIGIGEGNFGVMVSGGNSDRIGKSHIWASLERANFTIFGTSWSSTTPIADQPKSRSQYEISGTLKRNRNR